MIPSERMKLVARLVHAEEGSDELDRAVWLSVGNVIETYTTPGGQFTLDRWFQTQNLPPEWNTGRVMWSHHRVTRDMVDAYQLVPVWLGMVIRRTAEKAPALRFSAEIWGPNGDWIAFHRTRPALAICAAVLLYCESPSAGLNTQNFDSMRHQ